MIFISVLLLAFLPAGGLPPWRAFFCVHNSYLGAIFPCARSYLPAAVDFTLGERLLPEPQLHRLLIKAQDVPWTNAQMGTPTRHHGPHRARGETQFLCDDRR